MYWTLATTKVEETFEQRGLRAAGRFVLHRHVDAMGEHLDLRIETEEALHGWRIDATELGDAVWATEKRAHPKRWLEDAGDARTVDAGRYAIESESAEEMVFVVDGRLGRTRVRAARIAEVPASTLGEVIASLKASEATLSDAARLIEDGAAARTRAIARLCGLGRELDGAAFDETIWRKMLRGLRLDEIHAQLRAFEVRFDQRYPAEPVSRPERLEEESADWDSRAMEILRG
jgi:hypothetical protein